MPLFPAKLHMRSGSELLTFMIISSTQGFAVSTEPNGRPTITSVHSVIW